MWRRVLLTLSVFLTILALNGSTARGSQAARINIAPWGFAHPKVTIRITIHIERDARNRGASIILDSDSYYSESDLELDGDKAPILFSREVKDLGVGNYQAFLELRQWTGSAWRREVFKSEVLQVVE